MQDRFTLLQLTTTLLKIKTKLEVNQQESLSD